VVIEADGHSLRYDPLNACAVLDSFRYWILVVNPKTGVSREADRQVDVGVAVGRSCVSFPHDWTVSENAVKVSIPITYVGRRRNRAGGSCSTVDGTALAGQDYNPQCRGFGIKGAHLLVGLLNDNQSEGDETFEILVSADVNVVNGDNSITVTIVDDD
jgi:hypothetical protein